MQIPRDDRGATAVEYGLYVALVAVGMLAGVVMLTGALGVIFAGVAADPVIAGGTSAPSTPVPSTPVPSTPAPSTPAPSASASTPPASTPPAAAASAPGAARSLAGTSSAKGKVSVTWDAPTNDGGSEILGYDVEIDNRTGESVCAASFSSSSTQKVLSNTTSFTSVPGTRYCLRVRAINAAGTGSWTQVGPVEVMSLTDPSAPRSVAATSPSRGTLTVTWEPPEDNGGAEVTEYSVEIDDRSNESSCATGFSDSADTTVKGASATFTNLKGSAYCVRVRATNAEGDGDWAQAGPFTMSASVPGVPRDLDEEGESKTSVDLEWSAPEEDGGSDVTDYVVEFRKKGSSPWAVFDDGISDDTEVRVTGLSGNTNYEFRVSAVNRAGTGAATDAFTHKTDK